jgi:hypothetical protein
MDQLLCCGDCQVCGLQHTLVLATNSLPSPPLSALSNWSNSAGAALLVAAAVGDLTSTVMLLL